MDSYEECDMDRETLGWTVQRHVVDPALDDEDLPGRAAGVGYLVVGQPPATEGHVETMAPDARSKAPSPAP